jgi:hypothetical protein
LIESIAAVTISGYIVTLERVIFNRSGRFDDLVRTQLDLFAEDEAELLEEADEADEAQTQADRDEAEELYGDYQLVVDAIGDRLLDIRETYAATLGEDAADAYRAAFNREASKRFRRYTALLSD